ncbi:MAG: hypothetical protein D6701_00405, partial [Gemmatimonadetes bacterium]
MSGAGAVAVEGREGGPTADRWTLSPRSLAGPRRTAGFVLVAALLSLVVPGAAHAQERGSLLVRGPDGETLEVSLARPGSYATVPVHVLEGLGWRVEDGARQARASFADGAEILFKQDSPFFRWNDTLLQLADPAVRVEGELHVPVQLFLDFLPERLPAVFSAEEDGSLAVHDASAWHPDAPVFAADGRADGPGGQPGRGADRSADPAGGGATTAGPERGAATTEPDPVPGPETAAGGRA